MGEYFHSLSDRNLPDYPLGDGPLERIYEATATGEMRLDRALELAAAPQVTSQLSAAYAHAFGFHAARNAVRGRWREGLVQHQILLAAARVVAGPEARMVRIRAEREGLVTVASVLEHVAWGSAYSDAMAGGKWLLQTLDPVKERPLLAETFHYLGVLNLDPFTAHRTFANHELEHRMWLARTVQELGPPAIRAIPTTAQALERAQDFLQHAVQLATGVQLGDSMKALLQVQDWLQGLGQDSVDLSLLAKALDSIDPMQDPARWLTIATSCAKAGIELDAEKVRQVLAVSVVDWSERFGASKAAEIVVPLLDFQSRRDPQAALRIAEEADALMAGEPIETHRIKFFIRILNLFTIIAERTGIDRKGGQAAASTVLEMKASAELRATCLIGLAAVSPSTDDEILGLSLLDRSQELAPELHRSQRRALLYLRASLWLGIGSNSMREPQPQLVTAATAYGNALGFMLDGALKEFPFELLKRLEDIAGARDLDSASVVLGALVAHSLRAELATGDAGLQVLQSICRHLTVVFFAGRDCARLTLVWQVAKGRRSAAILASNSTATTALTPSAQQILEKVHAARRMLPPDQLAEGQSTSGDASFELWLTSYIRGDQYDGDQPWERLANLKMTFDGQMADQLASSAPANASSPLELNELQASLDARSALLVTYLGEYADGRAATYALLVTREETTTHVHVHDTHEAESSWADGERTAVRSQLGRAVGDLRRALLEDPGKQDVRRQARGILSQGLSPFYGLPEEALGKLSSMGKDHLIVAPHDALHVAPFHLFGSDSARVADHFVVTYLPNLALLSAARRSRRAAAEPGGSACIALGFAAEEGGWRPIPETLEEAKSVAGVLHVEPLLDTDATKPRVVDALRRSRRIHIATHGAMDVDAPAFQMLVLHPAEDEQAGRLYAYEVLDLDLRALDLVTLSACETALGRIDRAENLRGMAAAFFSAGVATVIGTLWPVESHASETFFGTLYNALTAGDSRRDAFRKAQLVTRKGFPQYRDWGPFYLAGDWS